MKNKEFGRTIIMVALIGVLILLAINSNATAQEGREEQNLIEVNEDTGEVREPLPGGPGFVTINPTALRPKYPGKEWTYPDNYNLYNPMTSQLFLIAPVNLPHGSIVNKVVLYYYEYTASYPMTAILTRKSLDGQSLQNMCYINTTTISGYGNISAPVIWYETIDNLNYSYFIQVAMPGNQGNLLQFTGLRIDYGYPSYLPSIMN